MITWTFRILRLARFLKIEAIREYAFGTDVLCRQSFKLSKQFLRGERMRFLLGVCGCFIVLASSAMAQQFGEYNSPSETYVASACVTNTLEQDIVINYAFGENDAIEATLKPNHTFIFRQSFANGTRPVALSLILFQKMAGNFY